MVWAFGSVLRLRWIAAAVFALTIPLYAQTAGPLPDAPSYAKLHLPEDTQSVIVTTPPAPDAKTAQQDALNRRIKPCRPSDLGCPPTNRQFVLNSRSPVPILTPKDKLVLAAQNFSDPFNLGVTAFFSAVNVASDSHGPYGPGLKGFGKNFGVGVTGSLTAEFFGTFAIPAIAHQDPRYHRMPEASIKRRIWHAISRTAISQSDHGRTIPNYSTLLTYPIGNELANLYVPGIQRDAASTGKRIAIGYATDPIGNLLAEFLPDIGRRIHVRSVFIQQIINKMAIGNMNVDNATGP
ncbi:MAG: hypothetical protein JSS87_00560 [Acidobacteria bacterium]|nr:hypothetical protein [Acidobacteriota bacterium]